MTWWWKSLFSKRALDAQLTSEVRFHIEELTDANIAAGMSPIEARRRAVLEFGGGEQIKEVLALGALCGQIVKQFVLQGLGTAITGCLAGWGLAIAEGRLLSGMLYGVSPSDLTTLVSVVVMVLLVAAIASLIPAVRAARLDPMRVLREE